MKFVEAAKNFIKLAEARKKYLRSFKFLWNFIELTHDFKHTLKAKFQNQ